MAKCTDPSFNKCMIYEIILYAFASEPTFKSVEEELDLRHKGEGGCV